MTQNITRSAVCRLEAFNKRADTAWEAAPKALLGALQTDQFKAYMGRKAAHASWSSQTIAGPLKACMLQRAGYGADKGRSMAAPLVAVPRIAAAAARGVRGFVAAAAGAAGVAIAGARGREWGHALGRAGSLPLGALTLGAGLLEAGLTWAGAALGACLGACYGAGFAAVCLVSDMLSSHPTYGLNGRKVRLRARPA